MKNLKIPFIHILLLLFVFSHSTAQESISQYNFRSIPRFFSKNVSQLNSDIKYYSSVGPVKVFFQKKSISFMVQKQQVKKDFEKNTVLVKTSHNIIRRREQYHYIKLNFLNSNSNPEVTGEEKIKGKSTCVSGNDSTKWVRDIQNFSKIKYKELYDNIDAVYYGNDKELKYDIILKPGADIKNLVLCYETNESGTLEKNDNGDLLLQISDNILGEKKPYCYQKINGVKQEVECSYKILDKNKMTFTYEVSGYNPEFPVIIDPELVFSTYIGGLSIDRVNSLTTDNKGNIYTAVFTESPDFPQTADYSSDNNTIKSDFAVCKFDPTGKNLIYSIMIRGSKTDDCQNISVDNVGRVYITGTTTSDDFPLKNAIYKRNNGNGDAFVCIIDSKGENLLFSTFLGGEKSDVAECIEFDSLGYIYITGQTGSKKFPVSSNAVSRKYNGGDADGFFSIVDYKNKRLIYSSYLGGRDSDSIHGFYVESPDVLYFAGTTASDDYPTTPNAFGKEYKGGLWNNQRGFWDVYVTKLNIKTNEFIYSTYLGGREWEECFGLSVDEDGHAFVAGKTQSPDFPVTPNAYDRTFNGGEFDIYVTKLSTDGGHLVYSTYIGGSGKEECNGIDIDKNGNAVIIGATCSINYPNTNDAFQKNYKGGEYDGIISILNSSGSRLLYSTFFGGSGTDQLYNVELDENSNLLISGLTLSDNFPVSEDCYEADYNGQHDGVIMKFKCEANPDKESKFFTGLLFAHILDDHGYEYIVTVDSMDKNLNYLSILRPQHWLINSPVLTGDSKTLIYTADIDTTIQGENITYSEIWKLDCTSKNKTLLYKPDDPLTSPNLVKHLRLSPDEKEIVFSLFKKDMFSEGELWSLNFETGRIGKCDVNIGKYGKSGKNLIYPEYSPDGKYLIFCNSPASAKVSRVFIKNLETDEVVLFKDQMEKIENIKWSPEGRNILIGMKNRKNLFMFRADGTKRFNFIDNLKSLFPYFRQHVEDNIFVEDFDWSPDGENVIVYLSIDERVELWIVDKNFNNPRWIKEVKNFRIKYLNWGGYKKIKCSEEIVANGTKIAMNKNLKIAIYVLLASVVLILSITFIVKKRNMELEIKSSEDARRVSDSIRKEVMFLLRDFDHSGINAKIFDNMEFCFENIFSRGYPDEDLFNKLKIQAEKYNKIAVPSLRRIIDSGKYLPELKVFVNKLNNINEKIVNELKVIGKEDNVKEINERYYHDLKYYTESFNLDIKMIIEHLNSYYKTDVWRNTDNLISIFRESYDSGIKYKFDVQELNDKVAVIEQNDFTFVIENLLTNAVKAVKHSRKKEIGIKIFSDRRRIFIKVRDTGCGIPKGKRESIFLYHNHIDNQDEQSNGYGLKRSVSILNVYGGILKVEDSVPGQGTTMILSLKINRA